MGERIPLLYVGALRIDKDTLLEGNPWCSGWFRLQKVRVFRIKKSEREDERKYHRNVIPLDDYETISRLLILEEDDQHWYYATECYNFTLRELIYPSGGNDVDEERFWCQYHGKQYPKPALISMMRDILSSFSYLLKNQRTLSNLSISDVLITLDEKNVQARIWPINVIVADIPEDGMGHFLDLLVPVFYEMMCKESFENDLDSIRHIPEAEGFMNMLRVAHHHPIRCIKRHPIFWDANRCLDFCLEIFGHVDPRRNLGGQPQDEFKSRVSNFGEELITDVDGWGCWLSARNRTNLEPWRYKYDDIVDLIRLLRNVKCRPDVSTFQDIIGVEQQKFVTVQQKYPELFSGLYQIMLTDPYIWSLHGFVDRFC